MPGLVVATQRLGVQAVAYIAIQGQHGLASILFGAFGRPGGESKNNMALGGGTQGAGPLFAEARSALALAAKARGCVTVSSYRRLSVGAFCNRES